MRLDNDISEQVVIVGGGITGLSAAYLAAKAGKSVTVLEASASFGGLLNTFEIGNNRLEYYYHHFFTHDAELNWLINDLNLAGKLFFKKTTMGVFRNGKIYDFNGPLDLLKFQPINWVDKIRFALSTFYLGKMADWQSFENIAGIDWLNKWAGKNTTHSLWAPLLNIKFGPYASKVPLAWMIGRLRQRMNSRKNGEEKLGYLEGSLQILVDALLERLSELNVRLISNSPVQEICIKNKQIQYVKTPGGDYTGKDFLFTIPGIYLGKLLAPDLPELSAALSNIKYFGAVCVIVELNQPLSNIYWLNIADEGFPFGGIIEQTNFIDPEKYNGGHIIYLSRYFAMEEAIAKLPEKEIKELMLKYLPKINPAFNPGWIKNVFVFRTNTAATVCDLNFSLKVPACKTVIENMFIANMSHIYPDERSTNNSIRIAAEACRVMDINTDFVPKKYSLSGKIGF